MSGIGPHWSTCQRERAWRLPRPLPCCFQSTITILTTFTATAERLEALAERNRASAKEKTEKSVDLAYAASDLNQEADKADKAARRIRELVGKESLV